MLETLGDASIVDRAGYLAELCVCIVKELMPVDGQALSKYVQEHQLGGCLLGTALDRLALLVLSNVFRTRITENLLDSFFC